MKKAICSVVVGMSAAAALNQRAAAATVLIDPSIATSSSSPQSGSPSNLIDSSSLSSSLGTEGSSIPYPSSFPTVDQNDSDGIPDGYYGDSRWYYTGGTDSAPVTLTFSLDQAYTLSGIYYYNYTENYAGSYYNSRGVEVGNVFYSTNEGATYSLLGQVTFAEASTSTTYSGSAINFSGITGVDSVEIALPSYDNSDNPNNYGDGQFLGLNEVRFIGTTGVPEPAPAGLLAAAASTVLLRRRSAAGRHERRFAFPDPRNR